MSDEDLTMSGNGVVGELESFSNHDNSDGIELAELADHIDAWVKQYPRLRSKGNAFSRAARQCAKSDDAANWTNVQATAAELAPMFKRERLLTKRVPL